MNEESLSYLARGFLLAWIVIASVILALLAFRLARIEHDQTRHETIQCLRGAQP